MSIEDYRYLWDGTEPGWMLQRFDHAECYLVFEFADGGPSSKEIMQMHKCLPELRKEKTSHVYRVLDKVPSYRTTESLGNIEAQNIRSTASKLGLNVAIEVEHNISYLPVFNEKQALLIDDEDLSKQVVKKMIEAGVPVVETYAD